MIKKIGLRGATKLLVDGLPALNSRIMLRQDLANRLVKERYGSFEQFFDEWEQSGTLQTTDGRSLENPAKRRGKSTGYNWTSKGVPTAKDGSDHSIFKFCGLLNVDPLALVDYEANGYFSRFAQIRKLLYFSRASLGGLATLLDMYRPSEKWPNDDLAKSYFGRSWWGIEFTNEVDWKNNDYTLLKFKFQKELSAAPRAVHIAYRRVGVPDTMWRFYGTVIAIDGQLQLFTESGFFDRRGQYAEDEIRFRTYYGGRPVQWRVASLHEYDFSRKTPFNDMSVLGFNW